MKMEVFRQMAGDVAGGYMNNAPETITFATVLFRETVKIALMITAFNDLVVKSAAILMHVCRHLLQKSLTMLDPEFDKVTRITEIITRAIYGLKSAGAAFRSHLSRLMESMGHVLSRADTDFWMRPEIHLEDKVYYYAYVIQICILAQSCKRPDYIME